MLTLFSILLALIAPVSQENDDPDVVAEPVTWTTQIELALVKSTGNSDTQSFAGKFRSIGDFDINRVQFDFDYLDQQTGSAETAHELNAAGRWEYIFNERIFALVKVEYTRDPLSGFRNRYTAGPGIGMDVVDSDTAKLKLFGSVSFKSDQYTDETVADSDYVAYDATAHAVFRLRENLKLENISSWAMSTENSSDYRLKNEIRLAVNITQQISLGIRYSAQYQNYYPSGDYEKLNTHLFTSLIMDF